MFEAIGWAILEREIRDELQAAGTIEEKCRIAFRAAHNHWMIIGFEDQFKAAVAAVYQHVDHLDQAKLIRTVTAMGALSAAMSGLPIDVERIETENLLPLTVWWRESAKR
jgi:hypothetical protein